MKVKVEQCWNGNSKYTFRLTFPSGERESISNPDNNGWNRNTAHQALNIAENVYGMTRRNVRFHLVN